MCQQRAEYVVPCSKQSQFPDLWPAALHCTHQMWILGDTGAQEMGVPSRSVDPREHNWDQPPTHSHRNLDPRSPGLPRPRCAPGWTPMLLPCPGYYKQCCYEHWGTHISLNSGFLGVYAQQRDCWVLWQFYFQFFKESPHCSPQWLYQFASCF